MTFARDRQEWLERKAAEREANLAALCQPSRTLHKPTYSGGVSGEAVQKEDTYRDQTLLDMQQGRPCKFLAVSGCATNYGDTTVACHENEGKGMGIKAPDNRFVGGCYWCHTWYDQGASPRAEKRRAFAVAYERQIAEWRLIAADPNEPEPFRNAAKRALERLGASQLSEEA
jgi:hypothetical protein